MYFAEAYCARLLQPTTTVDPYSTLRQYSPLPYKQRVNGYQSWGRARPQQEAEEMVTSWYILIIAGAGNCK